MATVRDPIPGVHIVLLTQTETKSVQRASQQVDKNRKTAKMDKLRHTPAQAKGDSRGYHRQA